MTSATSVWSVAYEGHPKNKAHRSNCSCTKNASKQKYRHPTHQMFRDNTATMFFERSKRVQSVLVIGAMNGLRTAIRTVKSHQ
eukprot:1646844-Pyramimonas_sp.AAC.2